MATITSANAVFVLSLPDVLGVAVQLQGWAADDAFAAEAIEPTEVQMGVDGTLSAGYRPRPFPVPITLQASSPSASIFDAWNTAQTTALEAFACSANITLASTGKTYVLSNGYLTSYTPFPEAKGVLQPLKHTITFESIVAAVI